MVFIICTTTGGGGKGRIDRTGALGARPGGTQISSCNLSFNISRGMLNSVLIPADKASCCGHVHHHRNVFRIYAETLACHHASFPCNFLNIFLDEHYSVRWKSASHFHRSWHDTCKINVLLNKLVSLTQNVLPVCFWIEIAPQYFVAVGRATTGGGGGRSRWSSAPDSRLEGGLNSPSIIASSTLHGSTIMRACPVWESI